MTTKIIRNGTPFDTQTFRAMVKAMTGGKGGLTYGLDLDQTDWIATNTDVLRFSPGGYIWNGEAVEIENSIEIQNVFANTVDGDMVFFYHTGDDASNMGVQIGIGRITPDSDNIILAYRKNGLFYRRENVMVNLRFNPFESFETILNPETNVLTVNITNPLLWDGEALFDGSYNWDGFPS